MRCAVSFLGNVQPEATVKGQSGGHVGDYKADGIQGEFHQWRVGGGGHHRMNGSDFAPPIL